MATPLARYNQHDLERSMNDDALRRGR